MKYKHTNLYLILSYLLSLFPSSFELDFVGKKGYFCILEFAIL